MQNKVKNVYFLIIFKAALDDIQCNKSAVKMDFILNCLLKKERKRLCLPSADRILKNIFGLWLVESAATELTRVFTGSQEDKAMG